MAGTKRSAAGWRAAFLRALARGTSVTVAAEKARVHYQTAYRARKRDAAFAAEWAVAVAAGRAALAAGEVPRLADDEIVRGSKHGRLCIMKAGAGRWSLETERAFLEELATTANVRAAAEAAGTSRQAANNRRRLWPAFAEQWDACVEQGWARVEAALVRAAADTLEGGPTRGDGGAPGADGAADGAEDAASSGDAPPMTMDQAITLYRERQRALAGRARRPGPRPAEPSLEVLHGELLRRIRALGG